MNKVVDIVEYALDKTKGTEKEADGIVEGRQVRVELEYSNAVKEWVVSVYADGRLGNRTYHESYEEADSVVMNAAEKHGLGVSET